MLRLGAGVRAVKACGPPRPTARWATGLRRGVRPPLRDPHQARLGKLEAAEEPHHLGVGAVSLLDRHVPADLVPGLRHLVDDVRGDLGHGQVAAGRARADEPGDDAVRVVGVRDQMQDRHQHDRHRLGEVERLRGPVEDRAGVAQVGVQVVGGTLRSAGEQRAGVRQHDGVVVHVDHPAAGGHGLRDLVGVGRRGDAGPDVEELPDPGLRGQIADRALHEGTVGEHRVDQVRIGLQRRVAGRPVHRVVVLAAEPVVIDPGDVRHAGVKGRMVAVRGMLQFWLVGRGSSGGHRVLS
jgi:hypothetical protein